MKKYRGILFYLLITVSLLLVMFKIIKAGKTLEEHKYLPYITGNPDVKYNLKETIFHNLSGMVSLLLLQIILIILLSRVLGFVFRKLGQPAVVGEIIAGIILGPSVMGEFSPSLSQLVFPHASLPVLQLFSQLGLILFMFVVGMEINLNFLKTKAGKAIIISHASIIFPYTLGIGLSYFLYNTYAPAEVGFVPFSLFIGIAMSITAFPVLARILKEKKMSTTPLGHLTLTCAAADDVTAWCILAAVISFTRQGRPANGIITFAMALIYVLFMLKIIMPFLQKLKDKYFNPDLPGVNILVFPVIILLLSAFVTEVIGIHALFGAFLAGVIMPNEMQFRKHLTEKTEFISVTLLLPLFFAYSGLRTQITSLNSTHAWWACLLVLLVAVAGKFGGSFIAAKFVGETWRNSILIGALINTRGLMELVVLNIGYDLGIISSEIFTMMVIMALITTCMTGPIINRLLKA